MCRRKEGVGGRGKGIFLGLSEAVGKQGRYLSHTRSLLVHLFVHLVSHLALSGVTQCH